MNDVVRINATVDRGLLARVDKFADLHSEDRSTAIRQLLRAALRHAAMEEALTAFRQERLTLREMAEALDLDVWAVHDLLASQGISVGQGSRLETAADLAALLPATASPPNDRLLLP
ncbi:MAG: UPF0175 family protein [Acidimicrobiales bacterium]